MDLNIKCKSIKLQEDYTGENDLVTNFTPFKKLTQMDHGSKYKMQKHKASRRLHGRKSR